MENNNSMSVAAAKAAVKQRTWDPRTGRPRFENPEPETLCIRHSNRVCDYCMCCLGVAYV